jgi:hypothetical protein
MSGQVTQKGSQTIKLDDAHIIKGQQTLKLDAATGQKIKGSATQKVNRDMP